MAIFENEFQLLPSQKLDGLIPTMIYDTLNIFMNKIRVSNGSIKK